jgi:hypothetical protein
MTNLTTVILFLLFTCMHFLVVANLRKWSACVSNASEVVRDCLKFEKHLTNTSQTVTTWLANSACDDVVKAQHALHGGEWSASRPGRALPPGGPPVPIIQEAGWAPEPVCTQRLEEKSFRLCRGSNLDRPVVQPVARHYTDWATRLIIYPITVTLFGFALTAGVV